MNISVYDYQLEWVKADRPIREYPIGTKFKSIGGGYWMHVKQGFQWCGGATFPSVGGDWDVTAHVPDSPKK